MRFFCFGLILYTISFNQAHAKVSWIEQKFTYALMVSEQDTNLEELFNDMNGNGIYDLTEPFSDRNNNNQYDYAEDFVDVNKNGVYDYQENYQDDNQNGIWDDEEPYTDLNNNGLLDLEEPFTDQGNGVYDLGEDFTDINGNNIRDLELWYVDQNRNGKWDEGDPFEDLNNNGKRDYIEPYTDQNNNKWYDAPEKIGDSKFNFSAIKLSESFTDSPNGTYDNGEEYEDLNGDGKWTSGEEYEDLNGDGKWTSGEEYEDLNGDGKWTSGEEYEDLNGDGKWTSGEEYEDLNGDGKWTSAEEYEDNNKNGIWDKVEEESIIYDTLMTSGKDITIEEKPGAGLKPYKSSGSFKSPGKALLYSGVLPGMGQVYMGNWLRGLLFVGLDAAAIGTWYYNNNLAEDKKKEYSYYANEHWDFGRWVHDYYKWYEYKEEDDEWNAIREVFINHSDSSSGGGKYAGCAEDPTQGYCYVDIWDHSHKVEFTWEGNPVSSSDEPIFEPIFEDLCGNNSSMKTCSNSLDIIESRINEKGLYVDKDHHFYEGIQKYDMFFAGWDDNDSVSVVTKQNGDKNATSPNQTSYRSLWGDYNKIKTLAGNGGKFMLINRVVSIVDALLLAKKWNNNHAMKLSLNAYPDLRNKSGLGGVKLSLYWK